MLFVSRNQYLQDIWFTITRKRFLITILALAGIYFLLLPLFWPEPNITLALKDDKSSHIIRSGTVTIRTWHPNISLFKVKGIFHVDISKNNGFSAITRNLYPVREKKRWNPDHFFGINRWTWPRVYNFKIEFPIEELQNKTDSDYATGSIYIMLTYAAVEAYGTNREATHVEKVTLALSE